MLFRTFVAWLRRNAPAMDITETSRVKTRVWPNDIDTLGHMNNGVYLSTLDNGRLDLIYRTGLGRILDKAGIYTVVVAETITFRKSLLPNQKYVIETRIVGYDAKAAYIQHRHVVAGEVYSQTMVRSRFLRKTGGTVTVAEVAELTGIDVSQTPPAWVEAWVAATALPPTALPAPSDWA